METDQSHPSGSHFGTQMDKDFTFVKEGVSSVKTRYFQPYIAAPE